MVISLTRTEFNFSIPTLRNGNPGCFSMKTFRSVFLIYILIGVPTFFRGGGRVVIMFCTSTRMETLLMPHNNDILELLLQHNVLHHILQCLSNFPHTMTNKNNKKRNILQRNQQKQHSCSITQWPESEGEPVRAFLPKRTKPMVSRRV